MKKLFTAIFAIIIMAFSFQNVQAQADASDDAAVYATIIVPIAISKTVDLSFGNIIAGGTGSGAGTVVIATDDGRTNTGGVTLPTATPGTITAAQFEVTGLANATYAITLPTSSFDVEDGSSNVMTVDDFVSDPAATGTLDGSGEQTIKLGATLYVDEEQPAGDYENTAGDLEITVAYN